MILMKKERKQCLSCQAVAGEISLTIEIPGHLMDQSIRHIG